MGISALDWLTKEIYHAEKGDKYWQHVLFALYPSMPDIWNMLSSDDKTEFIQKYYSLIMGYLAAFPLDNAYKLKPLLESNQLSVYGNMKDIEYKDQHYYIYGIDALPIQSQYVINATAAGCKLNSVLCKNLLRNGQITENPHGGINVCFETSQAYTQFGVNPNFYVIGPMTVGSRLLVADMYVTGNQAGTVAGCMTRNMMNKPHGFNQINPNRHDQSSNHHDFFSTHLNKNNQIRGRQPFFYPRNNTHNLLQYNSCFFRPIRPQPQKAMASKLHTFVQSGLRCIL